MHNLSVLVGNTIDIAFFMLVASSVMMSLGATPPIALKNVRNNQVYVFVVSLLNSAAPNNTPDL